MGSGRGTAGAHGTDGGGGAYGGGGTAGAGGADDGRGAGTPHRGHRGEVSGGARGAYDTTGGATPGDGPEAGGTSRTHGPGVPPPARGGSGAPAAGGARGLRIVRLANFVAPSSGGLRTALDALGRGYAAAGHDPVLIVPGAVAGDETTAQGRVITLPGPELPGTGGYRVLAGRRDLSRLLEELAPDRLEVCDRTTLRWTGEWARRARVPAVMVSHETADGVLRTWGVPPGAAAGLADRLNRRSAWAYSRIVCTTRWAEQEFLRIGARNVVRAPLGVDLRRCRPDRRDAVLRAQHARGAEVLLLLCSRLSVEKRPGMALDALAVLRSREVDAVLVVAGDGPLRRPLERRARELRLPVDFVGHLRDREAVAGLQAAADVCLAPGPAETFGLSALEALACGTPVVVSASSALPEVVGAAGVAARDTPEAFAAAVQAVLSRPEPVRRAAARTRAELFSWDRAVAAFLTAHDAAHDGTGAAVQDGAGGGVPGAACGSGSGVGRVGAHGAGREEAHAVAPGSAEAEWRPTAHGAVRDSTRCAAHGPAHDVVEGAAHGSAHDAGCELPHDGFPPIAADGHACHAPTPSAVTQGGPPPALAGGGQAASPRSGEAR